MRAGELAALNWDEVNLEKKIPDLLLRVHMFYWRRLLSLDSINPIPGFAMKVRYSDNDYGIGFDAVNNSMREAGEQAPSKAWFDFCTGERVQGNPSDRTIQIVKKSDS